MAIQPVPYIDPAPVPGPQRGDESTFDDRMDAKIRWDETSAQQFGDLADNVVHNAGEAFNSATEANNQAIAAGNYASAAQDSAEAAAGSATDANQSATNAQNSADAAAISAATAGTTITAVSTSSVAIGNGDKVFTVPAGKQFLVNVPMVAANASGKMFGAVKSYVGPTLTLAVTKFEGTGTFDSWAISPSGGDGPAGGTAGGSLTDSINKKKGTDLASASTIDPWSTGGNLMALTGDEIINGIAPAPQAGADRTLIVKGSPTITNTANIIVKGGTATLLPGDEIDIEAETTTQFLVTVRRGAGVQATGFKHQKLVRVSGNFIPKVSGLHRVTIVAPGGTGGTVQAVAGGHRATGGGAGGVCIGLRQLVKDTPYPVSVGAGAGQTVCSGAPQAGLDGGDCSFPVPGYSTMLANGGKGGKAALSGALTGGDGGAASGGDINIPGGRGGNITGTATTGAYATGGGAPGIQGVAYNGGDIVSGGTIATASGGASTGGKGGDAAQGGRGGGAGAGGPGGDALTNVSGTAGVNLDGGSTGLPVYTRGFANAAGAGAAAVAASASPNSPAFGGASAGQVHGSQSALAGAGFGAMGGTASFDLVGARALQGPGAGSGGGAGYNSSANGTVVSMGTEGGWFLFEWNT